MPLGAMKEEEIEVHVDDVLLDHDVFL